MEIDISTFPKENITAEERKAYDEHKSELGKSVTDNPWKFPWKLTSVELSAKKTDGTVGKFWFPAICDANGDLICNGADGERMKFLVECANFVHENAKRGN